MTTVAARRADIALRYGGGGPEGFKPKPDRIRSVRRRQVLQLIKDRHGGDLPDNAVGRSDLQLLLELGLTGPEAQRLAPWIAGNELELLIYAADNNWPAWSKSNGTPAALIGERVRLRFEEYARLGLWHLHPHDCETEKLEAFRKERRRGKERQRKRNARARAKTAASPTADKDPAATLDPWDVTDKRAQSLALVPLGDRKWWSVRELADYARSKPLGAFEGLNHVACRQAVLRAIKKLEGFRIVEAATDFKRGLPVTKVRRLYSRAEIEEVMAELRNEPPDE